MTAKASNRDMEKLNILVCDTETTGLDQAKGHRLIEVGFVLFEYNTVIKTGRPKGKYVQRIHPQRTISPDAQAVHGISIEDLEGCPVWEDVAPKISEVMSKGDILVAHNAQFDAPFLALELARVGQDIPDVEVFCTMENGRFATPTGKVPSLQELAFAFGYEYDLAKAHGAEYDLILAAKCMFAGLKRGFFDLSSIIEKLKEKHAA